MDKNRLLLAFVLMLFVAIAPSLIWPSKKPAGRPGGPTVAATTVVPQGARDTSSVTVRPGPSGRQAVTTSDTGRVVWVTSPLYRLGFSTGGGRLVSADLLQYQSFAPGDSARPVQLVPKGDAFLRHRLVLPSGDTVSLDDWDFQPSPDAPGAKPLRFDAERRGSHVTLEYSFVPDENRFDVHGSATGLGRGGPGPRSVRANGLGAVAGDALDAYRAERRGTKGS